MTNTVDPTAADRFTKQLIIWTCCLIAVMLSGTMSYMALAALSIPDQIDRLATLLVGALVGSLVKTGVDAAFSAKDPIPVTNAPGETIKVEDAAEPEPKEEH